MTGIAFIGPLRKLIGRVTKPVMGRYEVQRTFKYGVRRVGFGNVGTRGQALGFRL